jgi:hypothetical protein
MLLGRKYKAINNRVTNPPDLGLPIIDGQLSVSLSWESHPSGSISMGGIQEHEILKYRDHFSILGREFDIYGIALSIVNYAETSTTIEGPGIPYAITSYDIAVSLQGVNQEKVQCPILIRKGSSNYINIAGSISLVDLARKEGIYYQGYSRYIDVPSSSGGDTTLVFDSSVRENLRLEKQIIDYTGKTVYTRDWLAGNKWVFNRTEILDSVQTSINKPQFFKRTRVEGKDGILEPSETKVNKEKRKLLFNGDPLVLKPPVTRTMEEGDVGLTGIPSETNPAQCPRDVTSLKGLDLNFDMSGPRKTLRQTTTVNNKVMQEVIRQYGFAYLAEQVKNPAWETLTAPEDTPALFVQNPQAYWVQIEEQATSYIYKPLEGTMSLTATDPITKKSFSVTYRDELGNSTSTSFSKRYLTEVVTQGWRLGRFQTEQLEGDLDSRTLELELVDNTLDPLDRKFFKLQYESIKFKRFPLKSKKSYLLVDPNLYYESTEEVPFQTQETTYRDLGINDSNKKLIVATPAKDYVYPMMVIAETEQAHSFATMPNPQNVFIRDERKSIINDPNRTQQQKIDDLRPLKLLPELTTGEDTFNTVRRTIHPSKHTQGRVSKNKDMEDDSFTEYSYGASNQDQNFKNSVQNIKFRESLGRPGGAEAYPDVYVRQSELTQTKSKLLTNKKKPVYYLNSSPLPDGCTSMPSVQYNTSLLSKAVTTAKIELSLANFLSTSEESLRLAFFFPTIRPGDYVDSIDSFTRGLKRVKTVSFTIDYQNKVKNLGHLVTCDGTQVSLGLFEDLTREGKVLLSKEFEKDNQGGIKLRANISIREDTLGDAPLLSNLRSRRNR